MEQFNVGVSSALFWYGSESDLLVITRISHGKNKDPLLIEIERLGFQDWMER